jgi:hypothetical protein
LKSLAFCALASLDKVEKREAHNIVNLNTLFLMFDLFMVDLFMVELFMVELFMVKMFFIKIKKMK